jgi:hypothetical protein
MQDREVVAAIVAGDPDGFAEAYDWYAASLYAYCHSVLPGPGAAEAVRDTFVVAASKLDGLRDPDRLGAWLHAVARNECVRQIGPGAPGYGAGAGLAILGAADADDDLPAATLPAELRGQVLTASASGKPASGFFVLTATGGPVGHYSITVPAGVAGEVKVSPSSGSLPADGYVQVTVTVTSKVALNTHIMVDPGNLVVTVVFRIKTPET